MVKRLWLQTTKAQCVAFSTNLKYILWNKALGNVKWAAWVIGGVGSSCAREKMFERDNAPATNFNSWVTYYGI